MRRLMLTAGVIVVLVGAVLGAAGVLHVRNTENETSVTLDKKDLGEKTQEVIDKAKETGGTILERTGKALHNVGEGIREPSHDRSAPTKTEAPTPASAQQPATGAHEDADAGEGSQP